MEDVIAAGRLSERARRDLVLSLSETTMRLALMELSRTSYRDWLTAIENACNDHR